MVNTHTRQLETSLRLDSYNVTATSLAYLNSTEKRIIDIIGAIFGLLLGLPFFLIAMLIVKFIDRVPIIFHQERFGLHGKPLGNR